MIIQIPDYIGGYRIASLARCDTTARMLSLQKLDVLFVGKDSLILMPENTVITKDNETLDKFLNCNDYDVFEISDDGLAYLFYSNEREDNVFIVSEKCNSNCIMCPATEKSRRNGTTYSINNLLKVVNHIPCDAKHITITGGEPFVAGREIFLLFESMKYKFNETQFLLLTNGRIFSLTDYCQKLTDTLPVKSIVGIPIHGYNEQTHDYVTNTPGSFRQTTVGIENLLSFGFQLEIRIVISRITAPYLIKIAKHIINNYSGRFNVKFIGLEMLGSAVKNAKTIWISYEEAFLSAREAIDILINGEIDVGLYNFPLCTVDRNYWHICHKSISSHKVRYKEKCNNCVVMDACGGVFVGSLRFVNGSLKPILE